jgi:serine/threonine protein kinase
VTQSGAGAAGRRLGRYHLAEPLGGGPTGEVFRAKVYGVAGFERQFAIKRFHPELVAAADRAAQLAQAARLYGALEHPRIARMHEFGVAAGETFTATELVRGVDLSQLVAATFGAGKPLPAGAATALLSAAARAVGFAHGRGLAHLGLCPTNVLCTAEGDVKVTDFGFLPLRLPARPAADASLLARLPYLAPEQHRGETGTPATDVYQLGLLAYELLRGEPALAGGSAVEIERRALASETPQLMVAKALGHVVRRALARSPFERFPDAGAMADALDAAVRAAPLPGDRRDLAGLVRSALDQQTQLHESQLSGALRLPVPAPPRMTPPPSEPATVPRITSLTPPPMPVVPPVAAKIATGPRVPGPPVRGGTVPRPSSPGAAVTGEPRLGRIQPVTKALVPRPQQAPITKPRMATPVPRPTMKQNALETEPETVADTRADTVTRETVVREAVPKLTDTQPGTGRITKPAPRPATPPPVPVTPAPARSNTPRPSPAPVAKPPPTPAAPPDEEPDIFAGLFDEELPDEPMIAVAPAAPAAIEATAEEEEEPPPEKSESAEMVAVMEMDADAPPLLHTLVGHVPGAPNGVKSSTTEGDRAVTEPNDLWRAETELAEEEGLLTNPRLKPRIKPPTTAGGDAFERSVDFDHQETAPSVFDQAKIAGNLGVAEPAPLGPPPRPPGPESVEIEIVRPYLDEGYRGAPTTPPPMPMPPGMAHAPPYVPPEAPRRSRGGALLRLVLVALLLAGLSAGGYFGYMFLLADDDDRPTQVAARKPGAEVPVPARSDAGATAAVMVARDAAPPAQKTDAGAAAGGSSELVVNTRPEGAKVYLDGTLVGKTTLKLDATSDRHKLAVILPGYKLHTEEIEGRGAITVELEEVTPSNGPAGIKVRCKEKNRYYVIVDGTDTGQLCPTERIGVEIGAHNVEIYDPINDSRRSFPIKIDQTRISHRVRVD